MYGKYQLILKSYKTLSVKEKLNILEVNIMYKRNGSR